MIQVINVLTGILYMLLLSCCIIFKNAFVLIVALTFFAFTLIILRNNKNNSNNIINFVCIIWMVLCSALALTFKFVWSINVFEYFDKANIFSFIYGGLSVLSLSLQLYFNRYKK